ncbi:MAG TPA: thioesterase domain-containing protein, partial [Pyrinomonadaceae bacterium]|nr:thioesterase domain-containing protein [Pyrinomonadaceae bacterium]
VLDRGMRPVPAGVAGELYIGGVQLARGYLNRPSLTAERFVPDPFSGEGGGRLYRTGDAACLRAGGEVRYLGRLDHQVKVRGLRIEPGEIELALASHPAVQEATVLVREYGPSDQRLVAYLVPDQKHAPVVRQPFRPEEGGPLTESSFYESPNGTPEQHDAGAQQQWHSAEALIADVRRHLRERLPEYMVPSAFVPLARLPLTPNGKLDRRALPAPGEYETAAGTQFVGPRDALELRLTQIWKEVLGVHIVGVRDNFFERGGHSLLAVRLLARVQRATGVALPLSVLFQNPTVEHLAAHVRRQPGLAPRHESSPLVEIQRGDGGPALFFVHPSGGNVICYAELAQHLGTDRHFYGLQARGLDGVGPVLTTVEEMATSYVEAVRAAQPRGPYLLGGWSMGGLVAFEMARQLQALGQEVSLLALVDTIAPASAHRLAEPDELSLMSNFALDMGLSWEHLRLSRDELLGMSPDRLLAHVLELATAAGVVPPELEPSQIERLYHVFKTNVRAMLDYEPRPLHGRITFFRAEERAQGRGETQGDWNDFALEGVELLDVPGDHFTMVRAPHVKALAESLARCLEDATSCV